jgi:hypothetical protein
LTSGGSSGGEGALVGFRGSVLGIATDSKSLEVRETLFLGDISLTLQHKINLHFHCVYMSADSIFNEVGGSIRSPAANNGTFASSA